MADAHRTAILRLGKDLWPVLFPCRLTDNMESPRASLHEGPESKL